MGPHDSRSTVLTPIEEAMIAEFRRRTLLPLDDVLRCLEDSIPKLTPSSLHRCLERHSISRLPESQEKTSKRGRFADTTIGYVHIDICALRLTEGKLNMFLAIDRVSKFTYVEFHANAGKINGADFLRNLVKAFPYNIHTVLTDMAWLSPICRTTGTEPRDDISAPTSSIVFAPYLGPVAHCPALENSA
jgi:hypothetical protein